MVRYSTAIVFGLIALGSANEAHAQAWVGRTNTLTLGTSYQFLYGKDHFLGRDYTTLVDGKESRRFPGGEDFWHTVTLSVEYIPWDNLAIRTQLPLAFTQYKGDQPLGEQDDGAYHGRFSDIGFEVRYAFLLGPVALTPSVGGLFPLHNYDNVAHSSTGRGLWEVQFGLNAGLSFAPWLPGAIIHASYMFALSQRDPDFPDVATNRSLAALQLGYVVLEKLGIFLRTDLLWTHGGIPYGDPSLAGRPLPMIATMNFVGIGPALTYEVIDEVSLDLSYSKMVYGESTADTHTLTFGITYRPIQPSEPDLEELGIEDLDFEKYGEDPESSKTN